MKQQEVSKYYETGCSQTPKMELFAKIVNDFQDLYKIRSLGVFQPRKCLPLSYKFWYFIYHITLSIF